MSGTTWIVVGVAFAALCIWLTVRIINRGERWAKWTAVALACVPILYGLSFGPACWWFPVRTQVRDLDDRGRALTIGYDFSAPRMYWPIGWVAERVPAVYNAVSWFSALGTDESIRLPTDPTGGYWIRN